MQEMKLWDAFKKYCVLVFVCGACVCTFDYIDESSNEQKCRDNTEIKRNSHHAVHAERLRCRMRVLQQADPVTQKRSHGFSAVAARKNDLLDDLGRL